MRRLKLFAFFAFGMALVMPAYAETQNVKVSGSIDMYAFSRNNFDLTKKNDAGTVDIEANGGSVPGSSHSGSLAQRSEGDSYLMSITQLQVASDLTDNVSTVINLINQRDWNANTFNSDTSDSASEFDIALDLAYVKMKEIFYSPLTLTMGRQDLVFGRGFIVGWNPQDPNANIQADEFTQIQSFDAVRATLDFNPWTLDLVYSKIREASHNAEDDSDLWISNVNYKFAEYNAVAEGYFVSQVDKNTLSLANAGNQSQNTYTVGGRAQFDPISQITLGGELAHQFGEFGRASRDRDAWAVDLFGEYRFDNAWKPMLGLEYVHLSGEEDFSASSTGDYGSWNGAFRLPVYGWIHDYKEVYYRTGQSTDQAAGQNQNQISVYGSMQPLTDLKLTANYWYFWADESVHTGATTLSSSAYLSSATLDDSIGHEIDTTAVYSYTEDVTFTFYANWFIPGDMYTSPNDATASEYISEVKVTF